MNKYIFHDNKILKWDIQHKKMIEFVMVYDGPSAYQGGIGNMQFLAEGLRGYMKRNFDEQSSVERVKIEGRGPLGSRSIRITFPSSGSITTQLIELHHDADEEKLKRELVNLYEKAGFRQRESLLTQ